MEVKPGVQTTEFWVTSVVNVALAVLGILAYRGLVSDQEAQLWATLVQAIVVAVVPIAMSIVTAAYAQSRAKVKSGG